MSNISGKNKRKSAPAAVDDDSKPAALFSPSKFQRTSNWKNRKGPLSSGRKKKAVPCLNAIAHTDGTIVFIAEKTLKDGTVAEFYSIPIQNMVNEGTHGFKEATGVDGVCTRRGEDGKPMAKQSGSTYAWKAFVGVSPNTVDWTHEEVESMQRQIVEEWNKHGQDPSLFEYPSKITMGTISGSINGEVFKLDNTIVDEDIIDLMMLFYGIEQTLSLVQLAEEKNIVNLYFSSYEKGRKAILNYVDMFNRFSNGEK